MWRCMEGTNILTLYLVLSFKNRFWKEKSIFTGNTSKSFCSNTSLHSSTGRWKKMFHQTVCSSVKFVLQYQSNIISEKDVTRSPFLPEQLGLVSYPQNACTNISFKLNYQKKTESCSNNHVVIDLPTRTKSFKWVKMLFRIEQLNFALPVS